MWYYHRSSELNHIRKHVTIFAYISSGKHHNVKGWQGHKRDAQSTCKTIPFVIIFIVFTYPYFLPPSSHISEDATAIYPLTFVPLH